MIFQVELSSLDSELSQLQALIEAKRQQQEVLASAENLASEALARLNQALFKIEEVAPSAIASLKTAVLTLFDPGDHGGNQPTPDTDDHKPSFIDEDSLEYPTLEGQFCDIGHDLDWYWERCALREGQAWEFASPLCCLLEDAPLTGQSCMWATPFASPLCSILWEDAHLLKQHCTITPSATEIIKNKGTSEVEAMPYVEFVEVSDKVGYLKVVHSGEIKATYAGFTRKDRAEAWGRLLAMTYNIASGFEVRPAKHLPFKWELKLWDMSINQIQKLAKEDLTKSPRVEVNSAKPPAREPVVLDADRVVVGQRIRTQDGQTLEISSTLSADNRFFAKDANQQRQLIELNNVAEFLSSETPAQQLGIEPPTGWRQVQPQEQPIAPGALVRHCTNAKFNIFEYGIVQEISESEAQIWNEQEGSSKSVAIASLELIATDPQYAKVLDSKSEWLGQTFVITQISKAGLGYSVLTPKGIIWFRADGVQILDAEVKESEQAELPIYQRSDGSFEVEQSVKEQASILEVGDIVEIVGSRHPQHFGLVGTVESLNHFSELPISVRTPRGLKGYLRSDLKFISKAETAPKRTSLQPGQLLMGDRIVTTGNYIGLRRSAASFNTAERIATIQLAKDLKNLGFDPQLATSVMAGEDDASDF